VVERAAAVSEFMRQTILEEATINSGSPSKVQRHDRTAGLGALTTYGVLLPDADRLCGAWWSLNTFGRAIAAVQYIWCLIYPENENPVFAPWTPNGGGGPPCSTCQARWPATLLNEREWARNGSCTCTVVLRCSTHSLDHRKHPMLCLINFA
jgi:hypothetical protein